MANLTLERHVVQPLDGPQAKAGYSTVIFKEDSRGRTLHRVLAPGEPYRPGVLERFGRYEAYAVSASPVLRHRFSELLRNGTGERRVGFTSHVTLSIRVSQPDVLVERLEDDPLGLLEAEVRGLLRDWAAKVSYEVLLTPGFDVEAEFLGVREGGEQGASRDYLERLQEVGAAVGLLLQRVDISRESSIRDIETGEVLVEEERKRAVEKERNRTRFEQTVAENDLDLLRAEGRVRVRRVEAGMRVLESVVSRFNEALIRVAQDTTTPHKLREAVRELLGAREEIATALSSPSTLPPSPREAAIIGAERAGLLPGNEGPSILGEVGRMLEVLDSLACAPAERTALAGRILHVLAELCLVRETRNGMLDEHLKEVARYCERIGIEEALDDPTQLAYFRRFHEPETLRSDLAGLATGR